MKNFNAPARNVAKHTGTVFWLQYGVLHRVGGPAVQHTDGSEEWVSYGKYHRDDGPAIVKADGREYWYLRGDLVCSFKEYQLRSNCDEATLIFLRLKCGDIQEPEEGFTSFCVPSRHSFDY